VERHVPRKPANSTAEGSRHSPSRALLVRCTQAPLEHAQSDAVLGLFVVERLADIEGNELVLAAAGGEGQRGEDVIAVAAAVLDGRSQEQALPPLGQAAPWFGRVVGG